MAIQSQFNPSEEDPIPDPLEPVQLALGELTFTFSFGCPGEICSPPAASKQSGQTPARLKPYRPEGTWPGTVSLPPARIRGKPARNGR